MKVNGVITIRVLDVDTGELKRTEEHTNAITLTGEHRFLQGRNIVAGSGSGPETTAPGISGNVQGVYISERPMVHGVRSMRYAKNRFTLGVELTPPAWFDATMTTPAYLEFNYRFAPPSTTTRNITSIYLGNAPTARSDMTAYVGLSSACTQSPTEVLDIFYRLQFPVGAIAAPSDLIIFDKSTTYIARTIAQNNWPSNITGTASQENNSGYPSVEWPISKAYQLDTTVWDNISVRHGSENLMIATADYSYFRKTYSFTSTVSDNIGMIFGAYSTGTNTFTSAIFPATPSNFTNTPVQPIHNHNQSAVSPFLDVSFLATGTGNMIADGSGWVEPSYPEFYRIDIHDTGDIGVSEYTFSRRHLVGFDGSTYNPRSDVLPLLSKSEFPLLKNGHGERDIIGNIEEYDSASVVTWDATGVSIINLSTSAAVTFDLTTTPGLVVTNITQVAVDDSGSVYVACSNTGLHKITTPFGTPSIISYTTAIHGVPSDTQCYAVAHGSNDSIWAVFLGGLSQTIDGGITWTNYNPTSTIPFSHSGITDNNWSRVKLLRIDRDSPNNEMCIAYHDPSNQNAARAATVWWSTAGVSILGPVVNSLLLSDGGLANGIKLRCSRVGGFWGAHALQFAYHLTFATQALFPLRVTSDNVSRTSGVSFLYDTYNNPYMVGSGTAVGTNYRGLWHIEDYNVGYISNLLSTGTDGASRGSLLCFETSGDGFGVMLSQQQSVGTTAGQLEITRISPINDVVNDAWNGQHTVFSELVWDQYRWNGTAWGNGYHQEAIATDAASVATPLLDGTRHGFDANSNYCTGRSCIDASVAASNNFNNIITFAATISPDPKITGQHPQHTLFDAYEESTNSRLQLIWRSESNNVALFDGTTEYDFGTTPVDDGSIRRVVFVINGTSADCYIGGVLFGTNQTLASAVDLSNTSGLIDFTIAGRSRNDENGADRFFRGGMTNVQLWNVAWISADVINDFVDISSVILSQPAINLVARYELTQAINESKPTHASSDLLVNGVNLTFSAGATSPSFVATDYYTFGVCGGILKDNAISFTYEYDMYFKPVDIGLTDIENTATSPGNLSPVVPATSDAVIDSVVFRNTGSVLKLSGETSSIRSNVATSWTEFVATSFQYVSNNGYFEWNTNADDGEYLCGFINTPTASPSFSNFDYAFYIRTNGTFDIREGSTTITIGAPYVSGDLFRVERVGSTITYHHNGALVYTSLSASLVDVWGRVNFNIRGDAIYNAVISYTRPPYILDLGDSVSQTGKYNTSAITVDFKNAEFVVNGVPIVVVTANETDRLDTLPSPAVGEAIIIPDAGLVVFNAASAGDLVTASYNVVKFE